MAELYDILVRRQIYIEGLKHGKSKEYAAIIAALTRELRARLAYVDYASLGDMTRTALRALVIDLKAIARRIFDPWLKSLIDWLREFMTVDRDMLVALYEPQAAHKPLQDAPDGDKLFAAAWARPLAATGTLAAPFVLALLPSLMVKLERAAVAAYANRAKPADLAKAIVGTEALRYQDGALAGVFRAGNTATNTVMQHLSAQGNDTIAALLFDWYEWVSVLDGKTTVICINRDGNRYLYKTGPQPPAHMNCRSITVPIASKDAPEFEKSFNMWVKAQSTSFLTDAFDGSAPARYDGSKPITLADYAGKRTLIGA